MPEEIPILKDGYVGYTGGVHASAVNSLEIAENQVAHAVNCTVRGGNLGCRDGYAQLELKFKSGDDRKVFETGVFQGEEFYSGAGQSGVVVYAISGRLFTVDPVTLEVSRVSVGGRRQPLSKTQPFVFLVERDGHMIAQDGVNRPIIITGSTARRSKVESNEIFSGTIMADGWGRLALVDAERRKIRFSDHELDPTSTSLSFTELNEYYLASRYFQPPQRIGKIVALAYIPFVDAPAGFGPLFAFGERAAVTYDVSYPRADGGWVTNNIERMTLLNIGASGHRSTVATDNDLIFRDQHGRLRTLSQTVREQEGRKNAQRVRRFDREVAPWIQRETPWLRRWLDAVSHDDRYLFTALPDVRADVQDVFARGILAYNLDTLSNLRGQEEPAWDGLGTGLRAQAVTSAIIDNTPRLLVLSMDSDGVRRVYEQRRGLTHDIAWDAGSAAPVPKRIERQIATRWFDWKSPFIRKRMTSALLRLGDIRGRVTIEAFVRSSTSSAWTHWFTHNGGSLDCLQFDGPCGCGPIEAGSTEDERFSMPALPESVSSFYRLQIMFRITGWCELREMLIETSPSVQPPVKNTVQCEPGELPRAKAVGWDDLTYDAVSAPPA